MSQRNKPIGFQAAVTAVVLNAVFVLLSACGGGGSGGGGAPASDNENGGGDDGGNPFVVDQTITPTTTSLQGFGEDPRPVAAIYDSQLDVSTKFVANELVVVSDDDEELQAIIDELGAEQLDTFDPESIGVSDQPAEHLLRVDPSGTPTSDLADILESLGEDTDGEFSVSSQSGLELLALAAQQREAGHDVSPNWAGQRDGFTDGVSLEDDSGTISQNVFDWPSHGRDTTQDIDVVTAWQMLERTVDVDSGSDVDLSPGSVKIAILDGGFEPRIGASGIETLPNDFTPNGFLLPFWTAVNPLGFDPIGSESLSDCGSPCPWHGTKVASAAMAVPDNEFGAAGPAGPIADPLFITTTVDRFSTLLSFNEAVARDADIINMSYSIWGPRFWAKSQGLLGDFDAYTQSLRNQGILAFASTPNNGNDYGSVPRNTVHIAPCHNEKIICVNGLMWDSKQRDPSSSYGGGVDIAGPYRLWLSPTPGSSADWGWGNSYASPFVAGVAALVMHANPGLSADDVETILMDTAHDSPDSSIPRYVNAAGAVREALVQNGYEPIRIEITSPGEGETVSRGTGINLLADALDLDDGIPDIEWRIQGGDTLGSGETVLLGPDVFESTGDYTLVATATGANGTVSDEVSITVVNEPPNMEITNPADGTVITEDETIALAGTSFSVSDVAPLPDSDVAWYLDSAGSPFSTGHDASLDASTLALGTHEIRFVGTVGTVTGQDSVTIDIVEGGGDPPPTVVIDSPENGALLNADQQDGEGQWYAEVTLAGSITDNMPVDSADVVWTTSIDDGPAETLGTGATVNNARLYASGCGSGHEITLTVTDSEGQTRSYSINVNVSLLC